MYFMDIHIFYGFTYIFMKLTKFYEILQLLTIANIEDFCNFFQNISEKISTPSKITLVNFFKKFLKS